MLISHGLGVVATRKSFLWSLVHTCGLPNVSFPTSQSLHQWKVFNQNKDQYVMIYFANREADTKVNGLVWQNNLQTSQLMLLSDHHTQESAVTCCAQGNHVYLEATEVRIQRIRMNAPHVYGGTAAIYECCFYIVEANMRSSYFVAQMAIQNQFHFNLLILNVLY